MKKIIFTLFLLFVSTKSYAETEKNIFNDAKNINGGLIVHAGCGDGALTAKLCINDKYIVHGIDRSVNNIKKAKKHLKHTLLKYSSTDFY